MVSASGPKIPTTQSCHAWLHVTAMFKTMCSDWTLASSRIAEDDTGSNPTNNVLDGKEVLVQYLVHGEHMNAIRLENGTHGLVAEDLTLVTRVLQVSGLDILPYLLHGLRSG